MLFNVSVTVWLFFAANNQPESLPVDLCSGKLHVKTIHHFLLEKSRCLNKGVYPLIPLSCGHELLAVTKRKKLLTQTAKMKLLEWLSGLYLEGLVS